MSAKLRLTAWVTLQMLIFTAFVIVFFCVVYGEAITDDPQGRLVKVIERNSRRLEYEDGRFEWEELDFYRHGVYTVCYDLNGDILHGALPEELKGDYPFEDRIVRTIFYEGREIYIYDAYNDLGISGIWIRGVIDSTNRSGVMHTFVILIATLIPSMLVIAIGGGWFIAWNAFRPMEKIIDTADSISEGNDLSERIALKRGPKEMRRLGRTFDNMLERLFKSFNSEKQFASDASHELRTPIAVILAECDRARRKDESKEDFVESIGVIEDQARSMSDLVNQLLILTRLEQGTERYPLTQNCISDMVSAYCEEFTPPMERGISLEKQIEPGLCAKCNITLISSVLQNLLTNAYKYGKDNGHVTVELKSDEKYIVLRVTDDGIGISKDDQAHIFKRFWQADMSRGVDGGSGLGLSMVKEIAELHHGSVGVESEPGQGSCFTFKFPN